MYREETLDSLDLQDKFALYDYVEPITAVEADILIHDREWNLALMGDAGVPKLKTQAFLICRFEQSRAKATMHLDCAPDDARAEASLVREAHPVAFLRALRAFVVNPP
jgi:hypothetical protein